MDAKAFIGALSSRLAGIRSRRRGLVGERLQERLELCGASLDDCSQIGARHRDPGHLKRLSFPRIISCVCRKPYPR